MRILLINHFPLEGSGSGIYTKNIAFELVRRGHEVAVIYTENEDETYEEFTCYPIMFKNSMGEDGLYYDFPCFSSHPRSSYTYYEMDELQIQSYIKAFERVTALAIEEFKPDIIHAQHLWIAPYVAAKFKIPFIATAHGTDIKGFRKDERFHSYALEGTQKAAKVITISKNVDEEVKALYGIGDDRRLLIYNGYDEDLFKPLKNATRKEVLNHFNLKIEPEHIVFFAGKLTHFKGVDVLLNAARIYERKNQNIATLIAGNGELYEELLLMKRRLELQNVHFLGHIKQHDLVALYNIADVSVVPSRTEPFGLVAVEALACGTPVVGTNQGGLPDFIIPEVGELVEVEDDLALAEAIESELVREDKASRRVACHEYAKKHFSWKKTIEKLEEIYQNVLKGE